MKKIITLIIATLLALGACFGLTACGETGNSLDQIISNGKIVVSTEATFAPFESKEGDKYVGIDIEIAQYIADYIGVKLEIKDIAFDSVVTSVQKGQADLAIAALTISEDRKKSIDFSDSYFGAAQYVIVKSDCTDFDACTTKEQVDAVLAAYPNGTKAAAQTATTGYYYAKGSEDFGFNGFANLTATAYDSAVLAAQAVANGQAKLAIVDDEVANKIVSQNNMGVKKIAISLSDEQYGIGVNKNCKGVLLVVNKALKEMKDTGKLSEIIAKYCG